MSPVNDKLRGTTCFKKKVCSMLRMANMILKKLMLHNESRTTVYWLGVSSWPLVRWVDGIGSHREVGSPGSLFGQRINTFHIYIYMVDQYWRVHVSESTGERRLWVRSCFFSSGRHILFVLFEWFTRWKVGWSAKNCLHRISADTGWIKVEIPEITHCTNYMYDTGGTWNETIICMIQGYLKWHNCFQTICIRYRYLISHCVNYLY